MVPSSLKIIIYTTQLVTYFCLHPITIGMAELCIFTCCLHYWLQYKNSWIYSMFWVMSNCYYFINSINQRRALWHWQIIFVRNDREWLKRKLSCFFCSPFGPKYLLAGSTMDLCECRNWSSKVVNVLRARTWEINYSYLERNKICFLKYSSKC